MYLKAPLYVQTPTMIVHHVSENSIQLKVKADSPFAKLLTDFDSHCADYFSTHSTKFFNGKIFSKEKILNAYSRLHNVQDDYVILTLSLNDNALVKDQRDVSKNITDVQPGTEAIAVIDMENICIGKTNIKPVFTLQQMKIYVKERLTNWCISHEEDSDDEEEPVIDEKDVEEQIKAMEALKEVTTIKQLEASTPTDSQIAENSDNSAEKSLVLVTAVENKVNDDDKDFF